MKLHELNIVQNIQEQFVPADIMLSLQMVADGTSNNISHKFILARVVNYLRLHKVISSERFRELNEFDPPLELIDEIKNMPAKKLKDLAAWAVKFLENTISGTEEAGYTNPQEELLAFLNRAPRDN